MGKPRFAHRIGNARVANATFATRGTAGRRLALGRNALGLLALANIVARSALTAPGPLHRIHSDVPNPAIGAFPYTYIAGFFVPLAVLLHVPSIRRLLALHLVAPTLPAAAVSVP